MLSLGKLASGPASAAYYTDQIARGRDDYYAGQREGPGRWVGTGAATIGWDGEVDPEVFKQLLAGAGLRTVPAAGAVAGFDLTFRAPKSVSVLWATAPDDVAQQLQAAHTAAVGEALAYMERNAAWARRGAGGATQVQGNGFVGAAFTHHASRAGDPLLHTHVVVGNLTRAADGRWTALDARHLYRHAKTGGYLYQAALRREVTERLGLQWTAVDRGVADVQGVSREVIDHFSQRRAEILEHLQEHGGRSARAAQTAALETRRAKHEPALERQRAEWRSRAAEHGLTAHAIARVLRRRDRMVALAMPVSPDVLTQSASVFGRPEVLQALAQAQPAGADVAELERLADAVLEDARVVALSDGPAPAGLTEARFTTQDLLDTERELIDGARSRRHDNVAVAEGRTIIEVLASRPMLSLEQADVVDALCSEGAGVAVVRAAAGTGKTFALDTAREIWERDGIPVSGCALSARAALELRDQAAIDSTTIAALQIRLDRGGGLAEGGVLVVDEAGMVGTRDLAELALATERAGAKLVLIGDDHQLPEIQAGGAFRALADELDAGELHEIRRQTQAWDRQALTELRNGDVERWASAYRARGQITIAPNAPAARAALVNDWSRASGDRLMIAARRDDVRDLNQRARELRQARGDLGPDEIDHNDSTPLAVGDRVIALRNDRRLEILNGQRGSVAKIDKDKQSVTVDLDNGKQTELPAEYRNAGHLDHGYAITAHRAQGITVERTFVLGSNETYREWGYTAMSRHTDEARFYVSRSDLGLDRDQGPEPDREIAGIQRLLERSQAKDLAIDSLPEIDRDTLEHEHAQLRATLQRDKPPDPRARDVDDGIGRAARDLHDSQHREQLLREHRERLRLRDRRERADIDRRIERNREEQQRDAQRLDRAIAEKDLAQARDHAWLQSHKPDVERLLSIDQELRARDAADHLADRNVEAYEHEQPTLEHSIDPWDPGLDPYPLPDPYEPDRFTAPEIPADLPDLDIDMGP